MKLLSIRSDAHDSNVTYFDGEKLKYFSFERDFQNKHHGFHNIYGWTRILDVWDIEPSDVDAVCVVLDCQDYAGILKLDVHKVHEEIEIPFFRDLGFSCPIHRIDHHYAHTLSLWPLGVEPTIHFVFDGFGDDWMYRSVWRDDTLVDYGKTSINPNQMQSGDMSPSLGFIMTRMGAVMGLQGNPLDQAGKIMALKAYGRTDLDLVKDTDDIDDLNRIWDWEVIERFMNNQQFLVDYIATAHEKTEQLYLKHFREFIREGDIVGYSGGVAQNTIINKVLRDHFPNIVIPPHCNDQGLSLGAIEYLRKIYNLDPFDRSGFPFWQSDQEVPRPSEKTIRETAERLANGEIVGWYQGRGEVGPRALGNRSLLMNPMIPNGKEIINMSVKRREPFRPFGASVIEEDVSKYFYWNGPSPYMLFVGDTLEPDRFPGIQHPDGTCRFQTVSKEHEDYYELLKEFGRITGVPMLLNTSLNVGGRPIAARVSDALELYHTMKVDTLVLGDKMISKQ